MTQKREMFLNVHETVDKIVARYGYEKLGEFTFLCAQYAKYWDEFGSGEGFNFSGYSEAVLIYFDNVKNKLDEKHRQFIVNGEQMAKIAKERWEKEKKEERRREQKRRWYAANRKKRQDIPDDVPQSEDEDRRCNFKRPRYVDNLEKVNLKRRQKTSANVSDGCKKMSSDVSSDVPQNEDEKGVAQNDAYAYRNYELMNHKNFKKNYDKGGADFVDKSSAADEKHNPSSGLTGHNLATGSVVKGNHKNGEHKKHKNFGTLNQVNREQQNLDDVPNPPQPCGQLPRGEPKLGKDVVRPAPLRRTIYGDTWIRIGDDFEVDLFDPWFECFSRARKFLIHGFEMWCRKKLCGERHDKWWLKDQLGRNFANRQGDVSYMVDRENGKNANISGAKH